MTVKLLCLRLLLLVLLCPSWAKKHPCLISASGCDECIQSGPECAWCTAPDSDIRCDTLTGLRRAGCPKSYMYNPQGGVQVVKNESSTEPANAKAAFLQPQELSLRLRPGVSQSFPLSITVPTDQPLTELTMDTSAVPAGVNITFSGIMTGNPLVVQVDVEAARCLSESDDTSGMQNRTGPWSVHITPRGFSLSVTLEITLECQCECTRNREENGVGCSGHRDVDSFFSPNEDACRSGPDAPVCSGRGKCVEGVCECVTRENPSERYSGQFCECSNFDCPYVHNRMCGGHGRCMCGDCVCDRGWTGEDCSCSMETASCTANNQMLCNGRGTCECGRCKCQPPYAGPTCEICPVCLGACQQHWECVECRAFGTGGKKDRCDQDCGYLTVTMVETRRDLPQQAEMCKMRSRDDSCFVHYSFSGTPTEGRSTVVRAKDCPRS